MHHKILISIGMFCLITLMYCTPKSSKELTWNAEVNTLEDSNYILYDQMGDSLYQTIEGRQVKRSNRVIKTKKEALELGKSVFSKEFGKDYGLDSRRYLVHYLKGFWIVKGLQPEGYTGGTLVSVFDSENGELKYSLYWK